ncbi:mevalonate kinase [Batrachochytrium salamandrivorans]|nr:mevalonate kinase [Batrachochytrium salamandrivorans]
MQPERSYVVSAPGKVILFGEHAVVYGKSAIAASIDLRTTATINGHPDSVSLCLSNIGFSFKWPLSLIVSAQPIDSAKAAAEMMALLPESCSTVIKQSVAAFLSLYTQICKVPVGLRVDLSSELPIGAGLGSSASFSVCLATSLLLFSGAIDLPTVGPGLFTEEELNTINSWAFSAEKIIHGNPSGVDNSLCTFELEGKGQQRYTSLIASIYFCYFIIHGSGARVYTKQDGIRKLEGFPILQFVLTDTKVPKNTQKEVEKVRLRREMIPLIVNPLLDAIQEISDGCISACKFDGTQPPSDLLDRLEPPQTRKDMPDFLQLRMAFETTGSGGGGCALTLVRNNATDSDILDFRSLMMAEGFQCFQAQVGCPGVEARQNYASNHIG